MTLFKKYFKIYISISLYFVKAKMHHPHNQPTQFQFYRISRFQLLFCEILSAKKVL